MGWSQAENCAAAGGEIFEISGLKALEHLCKIVFQSAKIKKKSACGRLMMISKIAFQSAKIPNFPPAADRIMYNLIGEGRTHACVLIRLLGTTGLRTSNCFEQPDVYVINSTV